MPTLQQPQEELAFITRQVTLRKYPRSMERLFQAHGVALFQIRTGELPGQLIQMGMALQKEDHQARHCLITALEELLEHLQEEVLIVRP